ncbi:MAG: hypothetical protein HY094_00020 [Candidatus Melainabacteria bacterium]|nr:hypothetical protein [Candidatus Melainabacteria bacterium]
MIESTEKQEVNEISKADVPSKSYHFLGTRTERVVFLTLMTLLSVAPIIFGKTIPSHADWHIHIEHAYNFKRCFWQGQLLPRWIDVQVNGYGEPIFNYYAPLVYYLFTFLEIFFRDPILSMKWSFVIPMVLCTVFGYIYLRRHGSAVSSAMAMAFIIFSPAIHIFIYNTNWPTSTLGLAFLFLTYYGIDSFNKNADFDFKSFLTTSIGFAGMALAHLATAFLFILLSVPYFFLSLYIYRSKKFVKSFFLSLALGAAMAGFYLFPACLEKNVVRTDEVLTAGPLWDYSKNFLYTYLDRHRDDGYAWAIFDHRYYEVSNALFSLAVLFCLIPLLLNMDKVKRYFAEPFRVNIAITMFTVCFLMMTPVSMLVWLMIKPMQTVQFPWRFTSFILPFGASILVYAFDLIGKLVKEKIDMSGYKIILYCLGCIFSMLVFVDFINVYYWKWVPQQNLIKAGINVLWGNEEYRPNLTGDPNWKQIDFKHDFSPTIVTSSPTDITLVKWVSHERIFEVFSQEDNQIRLRIFNFPGWAVYIDGNKTQIDMDPKSGSILFKVLPGKHQVIVRFEHTPLRKASGYISLGAFILYLYLLSKSIQNRKFLIRNLAETRDEKISTEVPTT